MHISDICSTEKIISAAVERIKEEESSRKITEAVSKIREETSPQGDEKKGVSTEANVPRGEGGVIASGTIELRIKVYYTIIWGKIRESWILPGGLVKNQEGLEAIISFKILRDGKIEDIRFEKFSGNSYFDKSVLRAVEKADPLPPLPREFKEEYLDVGVRFHPSELS